MSNCTSTYVIAFVLFIIAAVIFHFYVVAPFLIGVFRGQQEAEMLAMIASDPEQQSRLQSSFPVSKGSSKGSTTPKKADTNKLVKPLESVMSFFEHRSKPVTSSS